MAPFFGSDFNLCGTLEPFTFRSQFNLWESPSKEMATQQEKLGGHSQQREAKRAAFETHCSERPFGAKSGVTPPVCADNVPTQRVFDTRYYWWKNPEKMCPSFGSGET